MKNKPRIKENPTHTIKENPTNTDLYFSIRNEILEVNTHLSEKINEMEHRNNLRYEKMLYKMIASVAAIVGGIHGILFASDKLFK